MSGGGTAPADGGAPGLGPLGTLARVVAAPVVSGAAAAIVFLVMIQGSLHKGHTSLDFNHVLGTLIHGKTREIGSTNDALGVVGDSVGPTGLWATILCGIGLMVIHELVITRLVPRHWLIQAVPLWLVTTLGVGVLFTALADARFDTPTGILAIDAGPRGPLVVVLCSLGFALVGARVHALATTAAWWEPRPDPLADSRIEDVVGIEPGATSRPD